jgi:hypothetical protein
MKASGELIVHTNAEYLTWVISLLCLYYNLPHYKDLLNLAALEWFYL